MKKKGLLILIKISISLGLLIYIVFFRSDLKQIVSVLADTNLWWATLSFSLHALGILISAIRWKLLLDEHSLVYSISDLVRSYLVSNFFNQFLPTRFGGDIIRISDTRTIKDGLTASTAIVLLERLSGVIVLLIFAAVSALIKMRFVSQLPLVTIALLVGCGGILFFLLIWKILPKELFGNLANRSKGQHTRAFWQKAALFQDIIQTYFKNRSLLLKVFFWALLLQINVIIHYYLIGLALGINIPFIDYFFTIPILLLLLSIPISINGIGVREAVLDRFFHFYNHTTAFAVGFALLDFFFNLLLGIIGGIIYMLRKR